MEPFVVGLKFEFFVHRVNLTRSVLHTHFNKKKKQLLISRFALKMIGKSAVKRLRKKTYLFDDARTYTVYFRNEEIVDLTKKVLAILATIVRNSILHT